MIMDKPKYSTTREKVSIYETTLPMLLAMNRELSELSKKKPEGTLTKSKVSIVNRLLYDVRQALKDEENFKYLDLLSDEDLPQHSDAVLILSQYVAAMNAFEDRYKGRDPRTHDVVWVTK